jgi:hypothetical protein
MHTIDVSDLPDPVARAVENMIQVLRQQYARPIPTEASNDLPKWEGQVLGKLTREEIYGERL